MAVGESPNPTPTLQRPHRASQNPANSAKSSRARAIVFSNGEGLIQEPSKALGATARRTFRDWACVRAFARQPPGLLHPLRMIHVKMVVDIAVLGSCGLIRHEVGPGICVRDQRPAAELILQKTLH